MSLYVPDDLKKRCVKNIFSECGEKNGLSDLILRAEQGDEAADANCEKNYKKNRRCHRQYRIDVKL